MNPIVIEPTEHTPRVYFHPNGRLLIEGKSLPEDVSKFFNPLIDFIDNLEADEAVFDFNLEYFNTSTSKILLILLKKFDESTKIKSGIINWHYEEGDEDSLEMAEIYRKECVTNRSFICILHAESVSLADRVNFTPN